MSYFDCWQDSKHAELFDYRDYFPRFRLRTLYANFNEYRLLSAVINPAKKASFLEVGCATGASYRFFSTVFPRLLYTGVDISESALSQARCKYPRGDFRKVDPSLQQLAGKKFDYVFSRDVILHQVEPFKFLSGLLDVAERGVFLRMRTRDIGATEKDIEKSCQLNYGEWAPYVVVNVDELISFLKSRGDVKRVEIVKNYMVLGGQYLRYLPKECYYEKTGTAETAVYIEMGVSTSPEICIKQQKDAGTLSVLDKISNRLLRLCIGRNINSAVWW